MTRVVERSDLEAMHARVRAEAPGGSHGLFGPGSVTWDVGAEGICLAAGGRAALMQVALPAVAKSIVEHSAVRHGDVAGRFQRTFANVYAMIFGRLDDALAAARHVWGVHRRIVGEGYHANDPDSLMWVHATLVDSAVVAHETFLAPLSMRRKRAHYEETKRFAWLFGIGPRGGCCGGACPRRIPGLPPAYGGRRPTSTPAGASPVGRGVTSWVAAVSASSSPCCRMQA